MIAGLGAVVPATVRPEIFGSSRSLEIDGKANVTASERSNAAAHAARGESAVSARVQPASQVPDANNKDPNQLSEEEEKQVRELKQRDTEVRAHEQAHANAGGTHAGPPSYEFTTGPDGKRYATSGEVEIDVSAEKTPEATIRKMDTVIRAALSPADPSSQDLAVARQAQAQRAQAQAERAQKREAEQNGDDDAPGATAQTARPELAKPASESDRDTQSPSALIAANSAYGSALEQGGLDDQATGIFAAAQALQSIFA